MKHARKQRILQNLIKMHQQIAVKRSASMDAIECEKRIKTIDYLKSKSINLMIEVSQQTVSHVICKTLKLANIPHHTSLRDVGIEYSDIVRIKTALRNAFGKDANITTSDCIIDVTNKLKVA